MGERKRSLTIGQSGLLKAEADAACRAVVTEQSWEGQWTWMCSANLDSSLRGRTRYQGDEGTKKKPGYSLGSKCLPIAHMIKTLSQDSAL